MTKKKKVSADEFWKIYHEREEALDSMPGGLQGAIPDMSDIEYGEEI